MSWINDIENADIEAGDKATVRCVSEHESFDGDVDMRVARVTGHPTYWLEAETNGSAVIVVAPATHEDHTAAVYRGTGIRGTGHIANRERIAWADGIEAVNGELA